VASRLLNGSHMKLLACLCLLAGCALDDPTVDQDQADVTQCKKHVHVYFEPTSGMDAITNDNGCWTYDNMMAAADGWGWCNELNGISKVKHAPADTTSWVFDDTNPVRTVALDTKQIRACYEAMPVTVPGVEVMARRAGLNGVTAWQKIVLTNSSHQWIVNHWLAELHASSTDVDSYFGDWKADPSIGRPQVNAPNDGASCDARVEGAVADVCAAIGNGTEMSVVKNDGKLAYSGGCLTNVVEALNACTK